MATAVRFGRRQIDGTPLLDLRVAEVVSESGTAASTTALANEGEIAEITANTAAVYAKAGATASSSAFDVMVPAGGTGYITRLAAGQAISIVTV